MTRSIRLFAAAATLAALALGAAACDDASSPAPVEATPPAAAPAAETPAPAPASGGGLAIEGEGLRLFTATGSARPLAFGAPQETVLTAVTAVVGGATPPVTANEECGGGPMQFAAFSNGLQLGFQGGKFVGWTLDEPGLTTADGVGVGVARSVVESSRVIELDPQSTLGVEFASGDLGGFLTSAGADATVKSLYAGMTCFFR